MSGANQEVIPLVRPAAPTLEEIAEIAGESWAEGRLTLGPVARQFERELAERVRVGEAVATNTCTAGLALTLRALTEPEAADVEFLFDSGIPGPQDDGANEVIVPAFTFPATVHAIHWAGLTPVFVDAEPDTGTVCPQAIAAAIGPRTRLIMPVTVYGLPPDLEAIADIAGRRSVPVVLDAAQGLGSLIDGQPTARFVRAEAYSFAPSKVITAGEGGAVTTDDHALAERLRSLRDYGKALAGPFANEVMSGLGWSARMSVLHAAAALVSLRRANDLLARRRAQLNRYRANLADLAGIRLQPQPSGRTTNGSYAVIFVEPEAGITRDDLKAHLAAHGIASRRYFFPAAHEQPTYRGRPGRVSGSLAVTERLSRQALALPIFHELADVDLDRIAGLIRSAVC